MKILCIGLLIFFLACVALVKMQESNNQDYSEIRLYVTGGDAQSMIDQANSWIAEQARSPLRLTLVGSESEADASVAFRPGLSNPNAAAVSYPYRGHIDVDQSQPAQNLVNTILHELLHLAGASDDHNSPSSVLYYQTQERGQITADDVERLRQLSGMSTAGRIKAQAEALAQ